MINRKILVSHSQKQHVYRLVYALQKNKSLNLFITSIFFKKNSYFIQLIKKIPKGSAFLKKRSFDNIDHRFVFQTIFPELIFLIVKKFNPILGNYLLHRLHDHIVAKIQIFLDIKIVIAYERQCYRTFMSAKKNGRVTILDLASIHPCEQTFIDNKFNNIITGLQESSIGKKGRILKELEYKHTDYVIALSTFAKESCCKHGIPEEKIFLVQLGVDINLFKQKENYNLECFEILFVSGIRYLKGIKDLIETFNALDLPNTKLTIIGGKGDALEYVKEQVNSKISYKPYMHHDELKKAYSNASIFVLPSYMDSWGQVVCEAMACGTPVIVSQNTGAKDIVEDGQSGFIVEVANKNQLAEKISYFYHNRLELERMGKNARKAVEYLTWENYYQQIDQILVNIGTCS